jgi:hypothetical protein
MPPRSVAQWLEHRSPNQTDLPELSVLILKSSRKFGLFLSSTYNAIQNVVRTFFSVCFRGVIGL